MGQCKYCKEEAGLLKSKHAECEKRHKDGASTRPIFLKGMDSWFAYNFIMNLN